ncbi:hypothetical protein D3C72_2403290 [compost metagenome]
MRCQHAAGRVIAVVEAAVGQRRDGDQFALVETGEGRVDEVADLHHHVRIEIVDRAADAVE